MSTMNVIKLADTEWAAPVYKLTMHNSLRLCVDNTKLSPVFVQEYYAICRRDECSDSLGDEKTFPTLDAKGGYWEKEFSKKIRKILHLHFTTDCYYFSGCPANLAVDAVLFIEGWKIPSPVK